MLSLTDVHCTAQTLFMVMQYIENLTYIQLVDLLAEKTSFYTTVLKDQRNTIEHSLIREEIEELLKQIELKKDMNVITVNRG